VIDALNGRVAELVFVEATIEGDEVGIGVTNRRRVIAVVAAECAASAGRRHTERRAGGGEERAAIETVRGARLCHQCFPFNKTSFETWAGRTGDSLNGKG